MSEVKVKAPSKNQVNKVLEIAVEIVVFPMLICSLASLFRVCEEPNFLTELTFISIALYEAISLYINGFINNLSSKLTNEPIFKRVWLGKHLHYLIIAIAIRAARVQSILFYLDYVLISFVRAMKVIKKEIGPRVGDLKSSVDSIADPIIKSVYIQRANAILEILLCPYLFFYGLFTFRGMILLAFLIDFFFFILFGIATDKDHDWVYHQIGHLLRKLASKNESVGKNIIKAIEAISKVEGFAKQMYPMGLLKQKQ
ncbi:hypothetical protein GPJ56_007369 [Histomonas meleagridis]|uniref:uncharacterized protein n=1 Tax=Histomonas meleagridis TaxID=135588 RepID=UPI0035596B85|nr:hypothetical protein GPJ56_007369 [Histomonas meleagridis]KAH0804215.1 hypothetical protein GO595_003045 [Histomonas meleagridis]